jgi:hypothetical protein
MLLRRVAFPDFCEPCLPSAAVRSPGGSAHLISAFSATHQSWHEQLQSLHLAIPQTWRLWG